MKTISEEFKKELAELNDKYNSDDELREEIIKNSRIILKLSKKAIYSTHREELEEAERI